MSPQVLQSLQAYPRLLNFVMTILSKLITKQVYPPPSFPLSLSLLYSPPPFIPPLFHLAQVWKEPKVWQGFIKCCEVTKPQSFPVLLQLPTQQLKSILEVSCLHGNPGVGVVILCTRWYILWTHCLLANNLFNLRPAQS